MRDVKTELEIEEEILNQVAHLRWAASQGIGIPISDTEDIPFALQHSSQAYWSLNNGFDYDLQRRPSPCMIWTYEKRNPSESDRFLLYGHIEMLFYNFPTGRRRISSEVWDRFYEIERQYFFVRNQSQENAILFSIREQEFKKTTKAWERAAK
jgi:hypothetical protein